MFDSVSRNFTYIKQLVIHGKFSRTFSAVSIGYKIIAFPGYNSSVVKKCLMHDVLTDKCKLEKFEITSTNYITSCSKLPIF